MNLLKERSQKILLLGRKNAGKTSMRSIIFANMPAKDVGKIPFSVGITQSKIKFMGDLVFDLWDCAGQDLFMQQYFESQKPTIFQNVKAMIYVFDASSSDFPDDMMHYKACLDALRALNADTPKVFCLVHKMDLLLEENRESFFAERKKEISDASGEFITECFNTSVYDETLYKAWSQITHMMIPNIETIEQNLLEFCNSCSADEVVLFEKSTFLVITYASDKEHKDAHRFEKISHIIKLFKISTSNSGYQIKSMTVNNEKFTAKIDELTKGTLMMVVYSNPDVQQEAVVMNMKAAKTHFETVISEALN